MTTPKAELTQNDNEVLLKFSRCPSTEYAVSRIFDLFNPDRDLDQVLRVLKRLAQLAL